MLHFCYIVNPLKVNLLDEAGCEEGKGKRNPKEGEGGVTSKQLADDRTPFFCAHICLLFSLFSMWMCAHCSKSFASSRALKIHEVKQHENATRHVLKCGTCHEEFEHANLLHIHMRVHHNVKVRCPRCKDIFEHPNVLKLHIRAHHSEPVCVACGLKFDHDKLLRLHMEHYHKVESKGTKLAVSSPHQQIGEEIKTEDEDMELKNTAVEAEHTVVKTEHDQNNGFFANEWEDEDQSLESDGEATSRGTSDIKEDGNTEGDTRDSDTEKAMESEERKTKTSVSQQKLQPELQQKTPPSSPEKQTASPPVKDMVNGLCTSAVDYHQTPYQPRRSSVIVTTRSFSGIPLPFTFPRENLKRKVEDLEDAPVESYPSYVAERTGLPDLDDSPEGSPESLAGSYSSTLSGDESGDSESSIHRADSTKRPTLRCNRCQEEFSTKMEYLHHLISHQKGDSDKTSTENHVVDKLKSSLLIKMEARKRDNVQDDKEFVSLRQDEDLTDDKAVSEANRTSPSHQEDHARDVSVPCTMCSETFPDSRELRTHLNTCHKKPHCNECGLYFEHKNLLKIHMNSYHSSLDLLQCYYCGKSFDNRPEFVSHVTSHETSLENSKDRRRKPNSLRRIPSGVTTEETANEDCSKKENHSESDCGRNSEVSKDKCQTKQQGDVSSYDDSMKSGVDDLRLYAEQRFPTTLGPFRHHKKETSSSTDSYEDEKPFLVGPEAKTRIFLPKSRETMERDENLRDQRRVPEELQAFSSAAKLNHDAVERMPKTDALNNRFSAFSTFERTNRAYDLTKNIFLGLSRGKREGLPIGAPPPLIPVVYPKFTSNFSQQSESGYRKVHQPLSRTASANSTLLPPEMSLRRLHPPLSRTASDNTALLPSEVSLRRVHPPLSRTASANSALLQSDVSARRGHPPVTRTASLNSALQHPGVKFRRAHQPVTRTVSANSAFGYHRTPFPTLTPKVKLEERKAPLGPLQDGAQDHRELPTRESINNITKEALLHSLSLKRRASAPELGTQLTPQEHQQLMSETPKISNLAKKSPPRAENADHPVTSPGRSRQLNEAYRPRRRHPRDFSCHHCGIYFGHKKLLKIHLDCYHGSSQELQCLRCEKNFSSRSEFLEHLMSHEGGDELLAIQRKRLKLTARNSVPLTSHEGETVIRRELNVTLAVQDTASTEETTRLVDPNGRDIRGEFRHSLPEELTKKLPRETSLQQDKLSNDLKHQGSISNDKPNGERSEEHDGTNFCFVCGQSFSNGKKLEHHISSHAVVDKEGRYCCSLCSKTFDHHRKLEIHTRSHTGFKPHKCELCGRCFPYYSSYYYHKMTHTEDRPHKCGVCGKGFIQTRYLRSHMKTHKDQNGWASDEELNDEKPEKMETSEKGDTTKSPLNEIETKMETEPVDQPSVSPHRDLEEHDTARILCSFKQSGRVGSREQSSPKQSDTKSEMRSETRSNEFSEVGGFPSTDRSLELDSVPKINGTLEENNSPQKTDDNYVRENDTATEVKKGTPPDTSEESAPKTKRKKYLCKHCHKNFSSYSSLHVHVRIHTGQRPYSCSHCFKKFTHSSGLKRHVRCHTGEKPYPCPACPSAFADRGALKSHIRTHTGERPFVCDLCNKTFTQPSSLRVHKKTVHAHEFFD